MASANSGLWRSDDGGVQWTRVRSDHAGARLATHPGTGRLYLADAGGLFSSDDGGLTLDLRRAGDISSVAVSAAAPAAVWITSGAQVLRNDAAGVGAWTVLPGSLPSGNLYGLVVAPDDAQVLLVTRDGGAWYNQPRQRSGDGGASWTQPQIDESGSFMPGNSSSRSQHPVFTGGGRIVSTGGDWVAASTDHGQHYGWSSDGYNAVMISGRFQFDPGAPDRLMVGSQDYNAALTTDAGFTWTYLNASGQGWGGFTYGTVAVTERVLIAGVATSWGGTRRLKISQDGGGSWVDGGTNGSGVDGNGSDATMIDPRDRSVVFWHQYRSTGGGLPGTWSAMSGCAAVLTFDPRAGHTALFGVDGQNLVRSDDHGATWRVLGAAPPPFGLAPNGIADLAYDWRHERLWLCQQLWRHVQTFELVTGTLRLCSGDFPDWGAQLPLDNAGQRGANTVAVDPVDPDVIYLGKRGDIYTSSVGVARSTDGGAAFTNLTLQPGNAGVDGGREAGLVRVHPTSRRLYVFGSCFGIWSYPPPGAPVGDLDGNGVVDGRDVDVLRAAFGRQSSDAGWSATADLTGDGRIGADDLSVLTRTLAAAKH